MDDRRVRLTARVYGQVQGVGFRYWVRHRATELGLTGLAANLTGGDVEVVAEGSQDACQQLLEVLRGADSPGRVAEVSEEWSSPGGLVDFTTR